MGILERKGRSKLTMTLMSRVSQKTTHTYDSLDGLLTQSTDFRDNDPHLKKR